MLKPEPHSEALRRALRVMAVAEVDMAAARSATRGVVAYLRAPSRSGAWMAMPQAVLTWDPTSAEVQVVYVLPEHRRQHLATALWDAARTLEPDLHHSTDRSPVGTSWAVAVGGEVPPLAQEYTEDDMEARGARLVDALWGFGPEHVISAFT